MKMSRKHHVISTVLAAGSIIPVLIFCITACKDKTLPLEDGVYHITHAEGEGDVPGLPEGASAELRHYGDRYRIRIIGDEELYLTDSPFEGMRLNYFKYDDSQEFELQRDGDLFILIRDGETVSSGWRFE